MARSIVWDSSSTGLTVSPRFGASAIGGNVASNDDDGLTDTEAQLLTEVPMGAAWLAGTAVALLLIA